MVRAYSGTPAALLVFAAAAVTSVFVGCSSSQTPTPGGQGGSTGSGGSGTPTGSGGNASGGASGSGGLVGSGGTGGTAGSGGSTNPDVRPEGDAGGNDTGPVGGDGAVDRPAGEAAAANCVPGALLCEDFESYGPGAAGLSPAWTTDTTGGTIQVDTTKPFSGGKGLHVTAPPNTSSVLQIIKQGAPLFPVPNNTFYGRMMMWLTQMPTGAVHFNTVQANGLMPGSTQIAKYAYGAMYARLMAGYTVRPTETALPTIDCGKSGPTGYPEKSWVCAEWKFDGPNNEMHYWLNGQAQTGVDVLKVGGGCTGTQPAGGVWQSPVFNKLMLGWYGQPFNATIEVWIDDVVVGTERIGCPKP